MSHSGAPPDSGNGYRGNLAATLANDALSLGCTGATALSGKYEAAHDLKPAGPAAADRGPLDGDEVGSAYYESTKQTLGLAWPAPGRLHLQLPVHPRAGVSEPADGHDRERGSRTTCATMAANGIPYGIAVPGMGRSLYTGANVRF